MTQKRLTKFQVEELFEKGLKRCVTCKETKSLDLFYKNKTRKGGHSYICKECKNNFHKKYRQNNYVKKAEGERARKYRTKNKEKLLNKRYLKQYGITADGKRRMLKQQNHQCKVCESKIDMISGHIDHRHKDGKIRGILCSNCNTAIGLFKDDVNILKKAIGYLAK